MKNMSTIAELDAKMILIAEFAKISVEQLRKLPSHIFIAICNQYHETIKTK
jgi:hypothetical protein